MALRLAGRVALVALAASFCTLSAGQSEPATARQQRAARKAELAEKARQGNAFVLRLQKQIREAGEDGGRELRRLAAGQLRIRAQILRELVRTDPAEALRILLDEQALASLRADFPEQAAEFEQHGQWEGPVDTLVFDDENLEDHQVVHHLRRDGDTVLEVRMAGPEPEGIECGRRVRFRGVRIGEVVAAMEGEVAEDADGRFAAEAVAAAAPACGPRGQQNIAVLLATFPGVAPPAGVTPASVHAMLFGASGRSLHGYWNEASYGQTSASGTVLGWYTLNRVYTCDEYYAMRNAAIAAADPDIDFRNFNRLFIIFPNPGGCSWAGISNVGCSSFSSADGTISASSSWMLAHHFAGVDNAVKLAAHEGGHALGLMHARSRRFTGEPLAAPGTAGTVSEYGDIHSAMGSWSLGHYNVEQKIRLGWLTSAGVQQVQSAGTYTLKPLEMPAAGAQALQVARGAGGNAWLWLEFRQPLGNYDTTLNSQIFSGALIHYRDSLTGSYTDLLDFTPASSSFADAALAAGASWRDPYTNLSISVASASSAGLTVNVGYASTPCAQAAPTLTLSPPNPSARPGASASYTLSARNNDSDTCGSRSFDFSSTQPLGWTTAFFPASVTLAPGQSATVTMTKTVPASASPATYPVNAVAQSQTGPVSAAASLTVTAPPPTAPLTVSFLSSTAATGVQSTVNLTVQVLSGTTPASGATVSFQLRKPDGSSEYSRAIRTDSNGMANWSYRFQNRDPKGVYTVTATATFNGGTATATTSVTRQ